MYCVIMAGGSGTRFWPYSRHDRPKQMLKIFGHESMLQVTVNRLKKHPVVKDIFIATHSDLAESIKKEIKGINPDNVIIEPSGKNTAPCIGLSALHILKKDPEAVMGVFPSDHLIVGHKKFSRAISTANRLARKTNSIITIGIRPTYPSTAYGYIQYEQESDIDHINAYKLKTFAEKPHLPLAKRFLESGDFLWNGGMFIWKADLLMQLLKTHMTELHDRLIAIQDRRAEGKSFTDIWNRINPVSIDYGLMEKVKGQSYVIEADFKWNDLGSWKAVYTESPKQKDHNAVKGSGIIIDGTGNYIQSEDHFTAIIGVDNLVVVHTDDATLVVPKDKVEDVKELVGLLKQKKLNHLL